MLRAADVVVAASDVRILDTSEWGGVFFAKRERCVEGLSRLCALMGACEWDVVVAAIDLLILDTCEWGWVLGAGCHCHLQSWRMKDGQGQAASYVQAACAPDARRLPLPVLSRR